jgi:pimeloyl-ACP methyl ester carboxylesterase
MTHLRDAGRWLQRQGRGMTSTIVLVHGAYADSSSWDSVVDRLRAAGHPAIAFANPLRSVAADAAQLAALVRTVDGPTVLVGHSYGGAVMTNVPADSGEITALVYVAGFALKSGESAGDAAALAPGSTLAETLERVALPGGEVDTRIAQARYHHQFCADLSAEQAMRMAVGQRPITERALFEPSGEASLWATTPSWFVFGDQDHNIPVGAHRAMGQRADSRRTVEIAGASHAIGVSRAGDVADVILEAARATTTAGDVLQS